MAAKHILQHHRDWLNLVPHSGPFLSPHVLERAFPQGLPVDPEESDRVATLRVAYDEWLEACAGGEVPALHRAWALHVLRRILELPDEVIEKGDANSAWQVRIAEHQETLQPDLVIVTPDGRPDAGKPRMFVSIVEAEQDIERPLADASWKASPSIRMSELLRGAAASGVEVGLVTNGESWTLVWARPGETTGYATWEASLWLDERVTLRAFAALLGVRRAFGPADEAVEALLRQSEKDQQEVTDTLGSQVRRAIEVLVQTIDRIDKERKRKLLRGVTEAELYEASVTVMMRLVFLLYAEERELLPIREPFYADNYAVSTIQSRLQEDADRHGEEVLEHRQAAWNRLLATFRAVHAGVEHEAMRLPAYGGGLFDPDRYPFLEGRASGTRWREVQADPLPIDDRTVLHLLTSLQFLGVKGYGDIREARRLSFKGLGVEQIGHVYEGLLDHTAVRTAEPLLGLTGAKGREPEVPLAELEKARRKGREALAELVRERTGRSESAVENALGYELDEEAETFQVACEGDAELYRRVRPFAGLVRDDTFARPVVIPEGSILVTAGTDRRQSGTYYTPRNLTEELVRYALEPLVYEGPSEGKPPDQWQLRSARDLLALRICDFAMGSGAFLVQACRHLSELLVEAWQQAENANPGRVVITPEGDLSTGAADERPMPRQTEERLAIARRAVVDRCLFGVDKNPMAVEMAKLSLWLVTLQRDRPFTFLDHALRCGDSLLGVTDVEQVTRFHIRPGPGHQLVAFANMCRPALARALESRRRLESFEVRELRDAEEKARLLREAEASLDDLRLIADLVVGGALATAAKGTAACDDLLGELAVRLAPVFDGSLDSDVLASRRKGLRRRAQELLDTDLPPGHPSRRPMHWALEFPEIVGAGAGQSGFDVIVSNPPFQGGQKITGALGSSYRDFLVEALAGGKRGSADLCAYFFLRAGALLAAGGGFAMLATKTIAQSDTREVGLDQLFEAGFSILRAVASRKWPGTANLEVAQIWARRGKWGGECRLGDRSVARITSVLTEPGNVGGKPMRLAENGGKSFQGSIVLGMGFLLSPEEAQALIANDRRTQDVLCPYLNGEDLNSRWDQSPSRWVINFRAWPLDRKSAPKGYDGPVAADYPACLEIVRERVKPEREAQGDRGGRQYWWRFLRSRPELYATIAGMKRVLVRARVSGTHAVAFVPDSIVLNEQLVVFAFGDTSTFALLQSTIHECWAREFAGSLRKDLRYSLSRCFETYPFPSNLDLLSSLGEQYVNHRQEIMARAKIGLTAAYRRFHDRSNGDPMIQNLREQHARIDRAVLQSYGWEDLDLDHGFYETKVGTQYTVSRRSRNEIIGRLLSLNHERASSGVNSSQLRHADGALESKEALRRTKSSGEAVRMGSTQFRLFER